ncbi:endospore germination permease [Clostridium botulinum]|nr:endospore germination permease [Clostridium botulinum]
MKREAISEKQMQLLIFSYPLGSYLLFNIGSEVKQDAWIASIIGIILSIPIFAMYGRLMDLYPGKNIFDILDITFGKILGKTLQVIFVLHIIFTSSYTLNNLMDFIKLSALWETPKFVPILFIGILMLWIVNEGIEVIYNYAKFNMRFIIIFLILAWLLLLPEMEFSRLQPILYNDFSKIFKEGIILSIYPFMELFIFLAFFDTVKYNTNVKNIFIKPILLVAICITIITTTNIMVLGPEAYSIFYYPGYETMKRMHLRGEYQRLEIIVLTVFTIIRFLEVSYCILGASKGVQKIFNLKDYRHILTPVVFLLLNFSYIMFNSIMNSMYVVKNLWSYYGLLIEVILPIIIFIVAIIKKKSYKETI